MFEITEVPTSEHDILRLTHRVIDAALTNVPSCLNFPLLSADGLGLGTALLMRRDRFSTYGEGYAQYLGSRLARSRSAYFQQNIDYDHEIREARELGREVIEMRETFARQEHGSLELQRFVEFVLQ